MILMLYYYMHDGTLCHRPAKVIVCSIQFKVLIRILVVEKCGAKRTASLLGLWDSVPRTIHEK